VSFRIARATQRNPVSKTTTTTTKPKKKKKKKKRKKPTLENSVGEWRQ
jgi:hypothetical protein